jgi:hypothetical protein
LWGWVIAGFGDEFSLMGFDWFEKTGSNVSLGSALLQVAFFTVTIK